MMTREAPKIKYKNIYYMNELKQLANSWIIVQLYEESFSGFSWHILHKAKTITVNISKWWISKKLQKRKVRREYLLALDN